ncbi:MAG: choice-of-anchor L domain-containing protein [Bacteroidota bacterium]
MKKVFSIALVFCAGVSCAQIQVDVAYTAEELVRDVLVASGCAETSNYSSFTGTSQSVNGIGYFSADRTDFPFVEGVVLSTGRARDTQGPSAEPKDSGDETWPGDNELRTITSSPELFNASYLQFDFVPLANRISFNFLFASEEYRENFQCEFSDVFAFILTDSNGVSTNLALIPGTTVPVRVTTIRPGITGQCSARNLGFFDRINESESPISLYGQTKRLTAEAVVIPGETYTIKLVIADSGDSQVDSAVFLEAGSFVLDANLGEDRTVDNGNPACIGETIVLDAQADGVQDYKWFKDGIEILAWAGNPSVAVVESGIYSVELVYSGNCISGDSIEIRFVPPPFIADAPLNLVLCDNDGDRTETFDFSTNASRILGTQDPDIYQVTFFTSRADADAFTRPIANTTEFRAGPAPITIYTRLSSGRSCYGISSFELIIRENEDEIALEAEYVLCLDSSGGVIGGPPFLETGLPSMDYSFAWYRDAIAEENRISDADGPSYAAMAGGVYHVAWQNNALECGFSTSTRVRVSQEPETFEVRTLSSLFADNNRVEFVAEGNGTYEYSLDNGPFGTSNSFENLGPGEHIASVRDIEGCSVVSKDFLIVDYPRFFTPNGDNIHDTWAIVGIGEIPGARVSIFDRYGALLFSFEEQGEWDGTFNGRALPATDYWFRVLYEGDSGTKEYISHFTLKR